MTPGRHRRYSLDFKLRVVKAAEGRRGSLKSIARGFEVSHSLVLFWLEKYRRGELSEEDNVLEKLRDQESHIADLERKIGQLTMELDRLQAPADEARDAGIATKQTASLAGTAPKKPPET